MEGSQAHTEKWYCLKCVPGTVLGAGDTAGNKTEKESCSHGTFLLGKQVINRASKHMECVTDEYCGETEVLRSSGEEEEGVVAISKRSG